jgi:uncharacterized protein YdbL (DUF1318 family)
MRTPQSGRHAGVAVALVLALVVACVPVTVNINFPQEKLDDAASQIVNMSRQPGGAPPAPEPAPSTPPKPGSSLEHWLAPLGPREAAAEEMPVQVAQTPKTDTEELRRLTESQNRRLGALQQWMARGCIGENNQGFVEPRPGQGCGGDAARLIGEENGDRQAIIDTFMRQNRVAATEVGRVKASFAKAYRDRAAAGQWIQTDRGDWVKK